MASGRHGCRLCRHHDGGAGGGDGRRRGHRLIARLSTIDVGGRLPLAGVPRVRLRRELGWRGLVFTFGVLLIGCWRGKGLLILLGGSHRV